MKVNEQNIVRDNTGLCIEIKISWSIEDILNQAENNDNITLTRQEAGKVLEYLESEHDCTQGINWDVIDYWIDRVIEERNK